MPGSVTAPQVLKGHAAEIWRAAFLSAYEGTCDGRDDQDSCAAAVAWSAVKENYRKGDSGEWVAKDAPMTEQTNLMERKGFPTWQREKQIIRAVPGEILVRRIAREHEAAYDVELTQRGLANTEAVRPACFDSGVWRSLPPNERTYGALLRRRFISRQYHEAVDQMLENGWEARRNPNRHEEFIFRGYVNTPDGAVFVRDVLVRRRGTSTWYPREVSRGASASTSILLDPQEIRYRGPEIEFSVR